MKTTTQATGSVKWEADATAAGLAAGSAILRITVATGGQSYFVQLDRDTDDLTLTALGSGKVYTVAEGSCTCEDAKYRRPGACKHLRGTKAALARVAG